MKQDEVTLYELAQTKQDDAIADKCRSKYSMARPQSTITTRVNLIAIVVSLLEARRLSFDTAYPTNVS